MSSDILNEQVDLDVDLQNVKHSYESTVDTAYHNHTAIPLTVLPGHVAATNITASSYSSTSVQFRLNTDGMNLISRDPILSFKGIQFTIKRNAMNEKYFAANVGTDAKNMHHIRKYIKDSVRLQWRELGFINLMSNIKISLNGQAFTFDNIARTMKNEFYFVDRAQLYEVPATIKDYATSNEVEGMDAMYESSALSGDNLYTLYDTAHGRRLTHHVREPLSAHGGFEDGVERALTNLQILSVGDNEFTMSCDFTCPLPQRLFSNFVESQSFSGIKNIDVQINFDPDMNKALQILDAGTTGNLITQGSVWNSAEEHLPSTEGGTTAGYLWTWFNCRVSNFTLNHPPELSFSIVEPSKIEIAKRKAIVEASGVEPPSVISYSDVQCNFNTSHTAKPSMQTHSDNFNVDAIPETLTFYSKFNSDTGSTVNADGIPLRPGTFASHALIPDYYNVIDRLQLRIGNREYIFNHKELYRLAVRSGMSLSYTDFCRGAPVRLNMVDLGFGVNSENHFISEQVNNFNISYTIHFYTRYSAHYLTKNASNTGGWYGVSSTGQPVIGYVKSWDDMNGVPSFTIRDSSGSGTVLATHFVGGAVPLVVGCDVARVVYVKTIPEKGEVSQYTSITGVLNETTDLEQRIALNFMPRPMVLMGGAWYKSVGKFFKNVAKKIVTPENFASVAKFLQENLLASGMRGGRAMMASNVVGGRAMMAHNVIGGNRSRVLGGKALPKGFM